MTGPAQDSSGSDSARQRIIEAALALFGQMGYARATTRAIAAAAGVNEVTLFRHFGSKKGLLLACMAQFNAAGFAETFEERLTGNYADDIRMMAAHLLADMRAGFDMLRLMLCEAQDLDDLRAALLAGATGNRERVVAYFQRQLDAGVVRPDLDARAAAFAFETLFSTAVLSERLLTGGDDSALDAALLAQMADIFVRGTVK
jgi:AcrR family transcriptional regulator